MGSSSLQWVYGEHSTWYLPLTSSSFNASTHVHTHKCTHTSQLTPHQLAGRENIDQSNYKRRAEQLALALCFFHHFVQSPLQSVRATKSQQCPISPALAKTWSTDGDGDGGKLFISIGFWRAKCVGGIIVILNETKKRVSLLTYLTVRLMIDAKI